MTQCKLLKSRYTLDTLDSIKSEDSMKLLEGKKALILGLANDRSIAWGITKAFKEQGASSYGGLAV
jgi:hypothetical protein